MTRLHTPSARQIDNIAHVKVPFNQSRLKSATQSDEAGANCSLTVLQLTFALADVVALVSRQGLLRSRYQIGILLCGRHGDQSC